MKIEFERRNVRIALDPDNGAGLCATRAQRVMLMWFCESGANYRFLSGKVHKCKKTIDVFVNGKRTARKMRYEHVLFYLMSVYYYIDDLERSVPV